MTLQEVGLIVSISGGVTALVIRPLYAKYKKWREKNPPFRRTMLRTLERMTVQINELETKAGDNSAALSRLETTANVNEEYFEAMLRERLESAYTIYAVKMGWCPSGEKRMLVDLFELHAKRGWNHIDKKYSEIIMNLPETDPSKAEK